MPPWTHISHKDEAAGEDDLVHHEKCSEQQRQLQKQISFFHCRHHLGKKSFKGHLKLNNCAREYSVHLRCEAQSQSDRHDRCKSEVLSWVTRHKICNGCEDDRAND